MLHLTWSNHLTHFRVRSDAMTVGYVVMVNTDAMICRSWNGRPIFMLMSQTCCARTGVDIMAIAHGKVTVLNATRNVSASIDLTNSIKALKMTLVPFSALFITKTWPSFLIMRWRRNNTRIEGQELSGLCSDAGLLSHLGKTHQPKVYMTFKIVGKYEVLPMLIAHL